MTHDDSRLANFLHSLHSPTEQGLVDDRETSADNPPPEWRHPTQEADEPDEPADEAPVGPLHGYDRPMSAEETALQAHFDEKRAGGGQDPRWAAAEAASGLAPRDWRLWSARATNDQFLEFAAQFGLSVADRASAEDLPPDERATIVRERLHARMERDKAEGRKW